VETTAPKGVKRTARLETRSRASQDVDTLVPRTAANETIGLESLVARAGFAFVSLAARPTSVHACPSSAARESILDRSGVVDG